MNELSSWLGVRTRWWAAAVLGVGASAFAATRIDTVFGGPRTVFGVTVLGGLLAVAMSVRVLLTAHIEDNAELGLLGGFFVALSLLLAVRGILTPGVVFQTGDAAATAGFWALPWACIGAVPLLLSRTAFGRLVGRVWRVYVIAHASATNALVLGLLAVPDRVPVPSAGDGRPQLVEAICVGVCLALSLRQVRRSAIGRPESVSLVGIGFLLVGAAALIPASWTNPGASTAVFGFWFADGCAVVGVVLGAIGCLAAYRVSGVLGDLLRPLRTLDPLGVLDVAIDPTFRQFARDVAGNDEITRAHVVRSAELSVRVGRGMKLRRSALREVALGALLHDIGRSVIPDDVVNRPGRLNDAEMALVRTHAAEGATLVLQSSVLAGVAPIVRHHHERVDGGGYPDGLAANDIPLGARIVAACDAYDALSSNRAYRSGMGSDRAFAILREHAGSQWDENVVAVLVDVLTVPKRADDLAPDKVEGAFDPRLAISDPREHRCVCGDALPETVQV